MLTVREIDAKTSAIRSKVELYEAERETNKGKAVEHWTFLVQLRRRLHNIEKTFFDAITLAEDLATVAHMDRLRITITEIAEKLKEVLDYYAGTDPTVNTIHTTLHEIAVKKVELQTRNVGHKKKCAFLIFFCD